jgi:hypothetical protein
MSEPDLNEASGSQKTPQNKRRRKKNGQQEDVNTDDEYSEKSDRDLLKEVLRSQQFITKRFDDFDKKVENLLIDNKQINKNIQTLQQNDQQQQNVINSMTVQVNEMKQKLLERDIVLSGLPDLKKIKPESVLEIISTTCKFELREIENWYAVSGNNKGNNKPYNNIFITFCSKRTKNELLLWKKTHGPLFWGQIFDNLDVNIQQKLVFINEKLIPEYMHLVNEGKKLVNEKKMAFAWHRDGNVLFKDANGKLFKIKSQLDLLKFRMN